MRFGLALVILFSMNSVFAEEYKPYNPPNAKPGHYQEQLNKVYGGPTGESLYSQKFLKSIYETTAKPEEAVSLNGSDVISFYQKIIDDDFFIRAIKGKAGMEYYLYERTKLENIEAEYKNSKSKEESLLFKDPATGSARIGAGLSQKQYNGGVILRTQGAYPDAESKFEFYKPIYKP